MVEQARVRAGRLQGQQPVHRQCRACATRSFNAPTEKNNRLANFDYETLSSGLRRRERRPAAAPTRRRTISTFAPRLGLTYKLTGGCRARCCAPASASPISESVRGRQPQSPQRAVRDLAERPARDQPARLRERADDCRPVPADRPGQADDRRRNCRRESRACRATATRTRRPTPSSGTSASTASCSRRCCSSSGNVGQRAASTSCSATTPTRFSPDQGLQAVTPAAAADRRASTTCCSAIRATARRTTPAR